MSADAGTPGVPETSKAKKSLSLVVVSAGASDPSSTAMLADRLAARTVAAGRNRGLEVTVSTIELRALANEIAAAVTEVLAYGTAVVVEPIAGAPVTGGTGPWPSPAQR